MEDCLILKKLPTETEAERRSTALRNRKAFQKKYGLLPD